MRVRWTSRSPSQARAMPRPTSVLSPASAASVSAQAKRSMAVQLSSHSQPRICTHAQAQLSHRQAIKTEPFKTCYTLHILICQHLFIFHNI